MNVRGFLARALSEDELLRFWSARSEFSASNRAWAAAASSTSSCDSVCVAAASTSTTFLSYRGDVDARGAAGGGGGGSCVPFGVETGAAGAGASDFCESRPSTYDRRFAAADAALFWEVAAWRARSAFCALSASMRRRFSSRAWRRATSSSEGMLFSFRPSLNLSASRAAPGCAGMYARPSDAQIQLCGTPAALNTRRALADFLVSYSAS